LIQFYSFPGETVLDPFLGSGTTSQAAIIEDRNSIGYEINTSYRKLIGKVLQITKNPLERFFSPARSTKLMEGNSDVTVYESGIHSKNRPLIYFHRPRKDAEIPTKK
jgi:hypothetical protein